LRIAIPTVDGQFCPHFGKCDSLYICEFNPQTRVVVNPRIIMRPKEIKLHTLGHMLLELSVDMVLAGGMNPDTAANLESVGIDCCLGMTGSSPIDVIHNYSHDPDKERENLCPGDQNPSYRCKYDC
jgi:predicted Fe-Mo cluster-binding NifX family protein